MSSLEKQSADLTARWKSEKDKLSDAQKLKTELDALRVELANAQRKGEYQKAGELAYGRIPELEKKLKDVEGKNAGAVVEEAVTADHVAQIVSRWTGIPVDRMLEGEREKLLKMEEQIGKRVVGQAEAVKAVSTAVRRARAGLQDPNRPIGSFMFLGPTGVGKTELTKALAEFLFDDEAALIRIDMSEYMEKHSVARLIGAPPGYVGYDEGGALTEAVRRRPYQVVLFDEIEKAHPDVFNVLLQVLDDGRLTDGQGRTVDFRNTLIVMTSNLGAEYLVNQPEGQDTEAVRDQVMGEVRAAFRPEFLNRVDEIILFHRLKRENMGRIVDIQMVRLAKLLEDRKITLALDAKARDWLAEKGYDPAYGARPLKRAIQKAVQDPLAELILSGKVKDGENVAVSADKQGITFNGEVAQRRRKPLAQSAAISATLGARFGSRAEFLHPRASHELRQFRPAAGRDASSCTGRLHWIIYWHGDCVAGRSAPCWSAGMPALAEQRRADRSHGDRPSACCSSWRSSYAWFIRWITEFAVTNRRVISKRGFIWRQHRGDEHGQGRDRWTSTSRSSAACSTTARSRCIGTGGAQHAERDRGPRYRASASHRARRSTLRKRDHSRR